MYEIDITSIYFSLYNKLSHVYLPLSDPKDEKEGCQVLFIKLLVVSKIIQGYVRVCLEVLGPNDEPVEDDPKEIEKQAVFFLITLMIYSNKGERRKKLA